MASTKAFTSSLSVLASFSVQLAFAKKQISAEQVATYVSELEHAPALMAKILANDEEIEAIARDIAAARDILFVGRGIFFPIAMEGALKLKEISYIHAEGYAAGRAENMALFALIDENVPVIGIAPDGGLSDKTVSNLQEIMARKGKVVLLSDMDDSTAEGMYARFKMPSAGDLISPILYAIPVQLLSYYAAVEKGTDVDMPRNLAKSVTVE